ncbi:MAG: 30S ribosomal protein S20 [Deltaproteobacteria bacterium]|jgi:small subunit ribosomal protein S20|nr:30S ribosomal protein S20 [Deltaproteobacteria bacterium]
MATKVSAEKRNRQNKKLNTRNRQTRATVRTAIKEVTTSVVAKDSLKAKSNLTKTTSLIAKAGNKGLLHKKNVARKISRLTKKVNALG